MAELINLHQADKFLAQSTTHLDKVRQVLEKGPKPCRKSSGNSSPGSTRRLLCS
jgi:hypothetical protein